MAYTSGRTVKSPVRKATTRTTATAKSRRLVTKYLPGAEGVTINSYGTADPVTLANQVRTVITYSISADASDLACAIERQPGVISSTWTEYAITILWEA